MVGSEEFAHRSSLLYRKIQLRRCTNGWMCREMLPVHPCMPRRHSCMPVFLPACPDRRCNIAGAAFTYGSQPVENCMPDNDSHPLYDHPYREMQWWCDVVYCTAGGKVDLSWYDLWQSPANDCPVTCYLLLLLVVCFLLEKIYMTWARRVLHLFSKVRAILPVKEFPLIKLTKMR